jgi:hypothetical protein
MAEGEQGGRNLSCSFIPGQEQSDQRAVCYPVVLVC